MEFYIVISTCVGYEDTLDEMIKTVPEGYKHIVVYSNAKEESHEVLGDRLNVYVPKNLYEYTAWLGVEYLILNCIVGVDSWFLFTHDTTRFTPESQSKFPTIVYVLHKTPINFYSLASGGFHNICLCRKGALRKIWSHLKGKTVMTKDEARNLEGKLPDLLDRNEVGEFSFFPVMLPNEHHIENRNTTYIHSIGVYKYYS